VEPFKGEGLPRRGAQVKTRHRPLLCVSRAAEAHEWFTCQCSALVVGPLC
jgi:hypothetical protein